MIGGVERAVGRTTPEAIDLQADFRAMLDGGDRACAMEVSSHALELGRADAIHFAAAIFTNLTQDHLDFHETMEDYFQAKRRLFAGSTPASSVVNVGDPYGRRLAGELDGARHVRGRRRTPTTARRICAAMSRAAASCCTRPPASARSRCRCRGASTSPTRSARWRRCTRSGATSTCWSSALERGVRVPGRFEPVDEGQDFAVLVDYAHTPDSLENVLRAARELIAARGGA